jgi:hypothetical protein
MATQYWLFDTSAEAEAKNAEHWNVVLGGQAKAEDTTRYLWHVTTNPDTDASMFVVTDPLYADIYPKLTPEQQAEMTANLVPEDDPRVQEILGAQAKGP